MKTVARFLFLVLGMLVVSTQTSFSQEKKDEKIRIAVAPLVGTGANDYASQVFETGLTNALVKGGKYEVVARSQLDKVLAEQSLNNSQLVDPRAAQSVGKLLGAKYIVVGKIVDVRFEPGLFTKDKFLTSAQVQLIDVSTGSIKISDTFVGKAEAMFMQRVQNTNTLTTEETQKKYIETVGYIASQFVDRVNLINPLNGYVVAIDGNRVAVNLGEAAGVKAGQEFLVVREGKVIKDPATGEVLSAEKKSIARLVVTAVEAKLSWTEIVATYSPSANVVVGTETVDLFPVPGLIQELMAVMQTDSRAATLLKELDKQRKKKK